MRERATFTLIPTHLSWKHPKCNCARTKSRNVATLAGALPLSHCAKQRADHDIFQPLRPRSGSFYYSAGQKSHTRNAFAFSYTLVGSMVAVESNGSRDSWPQARRIVRRTNFRPTPMRLSCTPRYSRPVKWRETPPLRQPRTSRAIRSAPPTDKERWSPRRKSQTGWR